MAEPEASDDKAVHQSLLQRFKDEPKWVKIGSLAGVAVLGITVLLYFKNQGQGSQDTGSVPTATSNGMGTSTDHPGEGDFHPPLPPGTGTSTGTQPGSTGSPGSSTGTSTGSQPPTSSPPITGIKIGAPPKSTQPKKPAPVHTKKGEAYTSTSRSDVNDTMRRLGILRR